MKSAVTSRCGPALSRGHPHPPSCWWSLIACNLQTYHLTFSFGLTLVEMIQKDNPEVESRQKRKDDFWIHVLSMSVSTSMFVRQYSRHLLGQAMQFVNMGCSQIYSARQNNVPKLFRQIASNNRSDS